MPTYYTNDDVSIKDDQGLYIPIDTTNSDYQVYLAWVAEGNTIVSGPPVVPPSGMIPVQPYGNIWKNISSVFDGTPGALLTSNGEVLSDHPLGAAGTIPQSTGTGLDWISSANLISMFADGRLTLVSGTPIAQANVSNTLYYTPYVGNKIALYTGTTWAVYAFTELSISAPATVGTNYDVFIYDNSGTLTLELTAWTNSITRATALTRQDGVLVKTGAPQRRYIGTVRTDSSPSSISNLSEQRHVWNMYNRLPHSLLCRGTTNYTYSTGSWREAGGVSTLGISRVGWVQGLDDFVSLTNYSMIYNVGTNGYPGNGIGIDSATPNTNTYIGGIGSTVNNWPAPSLSFYDDYNAPGYHYAARLELGVTGGSIQWFHSAGGMRAGMRGVINC